MLTLWESNLIIKMFQQKIKLPPVGIELTTLNKNMEDLSLLQPENQGFFFCFFLKSTQTALESS